MSTPKNTNCETSILWELKDYLPCLQSQLLEKMGNINQLQELLIERSFSLYKEFLALRFEGIIPSVHPKHLNEDTFREMVAFILYFDSVYSLTKAVSLLDAEKRLLKDILNTYRKMMLFTKEQKQNYRIVKDSLIATGKLTLI